MILVDSNIILDVTGQDPTWMEWSAKQIADWGSREPLAINCLIYAEISIDYARADDLDLDLGEWGFVKLELPYEAGFIAGKAFLQYRQRGGARLSPLPDFYIGAHALVAGMRLLTRDASRYRTYFPKLKLIAPK